MSNLTDGERLVALETKMDAVLKNQETSSDKFDTLNTKLETLLPTYATRQDLEKLKQRNTLQVWLTGSLSAAFGSMLTFLIINFVSNIGG